MTIDWEMTFKVIGFLAALAALAAFIGKITQSCFKYFQKPYLHIIFDSDKDLRIWIFHDTGWTRKFATLHIKNKRKETAKRCVAVLRILKKPQTAQNTENEYSLHWAGVDYTMQTTGAEPVDIGPEPRRLDVVFTQQGQSIEGCWAAIPFALSGQINRNQAYLPPGDYEVEIEVKCENGKGGKARFRITSPIRWNDLNCETL
jgi:hypothetical protein